MSLKDYRFDGEEKLELRGMNTGAKKDGVDKEDILRRTEKNLGRIEALQDKLYADGRESVLIILQAMDAAGRTADIVKVGCDAIDDTLEAIKDKRVEATIAEPPFFLG